jgi:hypothetical protein
VLVTAPAYTPASAESEGTLAIGTVSTLRPVQTFPDVLFDAPIIREVSRGGVLTSTDIGTSADTIESTLSLEMRPGNAAALMAYLQSARGGDITITTPANTWLFGIDGLNSATYICKLLSSEITVTHDNFNLFKMSIKLWLKSIVGASGWLYKEGTFEWLYRESDGAFLYKE